MRFPDDVTILRRRGADAYGNPGQGWTDPEEVEAEGFLVTPTLLLMPPKYELRDEDRVRVNGVLFTTEVTPVRSPSKRVLWTVAVKEIS